MNTRSRARNGATGHEGFEGGGDVQNQHVGNVQGNPPAHGTLGEHTNDQREQGHGSFGAPPPPPLIQMTPEALRQLVEDASAQAANRAVARYAAEHVCPLDPASPPRRSSPPVCSRDRERTRPRRYELRRRGTIESFEQLAQRFLHHFAINKRYPKTASYLFTIIQRENESLREYVQRFSEAVLEVPHVNPELLASIMQQNLKRGRFKESIAGKPPATQEELLMRAEKYIRIEESTGSRPITPLKRRMNDDERIAPARIEGNKRERRQSDLTQYTPLNAPRVEILSGKATRLSPMALSPEGQSEENDIRQILSLS
ncbi:UNVERIFIED_CONTAM: hypothetical protein Sradi_3376800 [Sesamum radiatum]|uniref:Retrotransposon gag domain-containing protein n=1 Tax=Sesamum radiatum TaxID=300843 RepID=A0AAW2R3T6_SESRA